MLAALLEKVCNVKAEWCITALVLAGKRAVHIHLCMPVNSAEMKNDPVTLPVRRDCESPLIPERIFLCHSASHSGKSRLHCKRNKDLSISAL